MTVTPAFLYTRRMVVLGQSLELLHSAFRYCIRHNGYAQFEVPGRTRRRPATDIFQDFKGSILDTLHLINCAVQAGLTKSGLPAKTMNALDKSLCALQSMVEDQLNIWASNVMDSDLQSSLKKAVDGPTTTGRTVTVTQLHMLVRQLISATELAKPTLQEIWKLLGYTQENRNSWLETRITAAKHAPLMRNGKAGYWLTLVENMAWEPTFTLLGVELRFPPEQGSSQGRARLPELLATLPGFSTEEASHQALISPRAVRIPEDVSVAVEGGYLVLSRHVPTPVESKKVKDVEAWGAFCKKQLIPPPTKEDRKVSVTCGAENLVKGLEALQRLTALKVDGDAKLLAMFETNLQEAQRAAAVNKLKQHFNPEEMKQLAEYFASQQ